MSAEIPTDQGECLDLEDIESVRSGDQYYNTNNHVEIQRLERSMGEERADAPIGLLRGAVIKVFNVDHSERFGRVLNVELSYHKGTKEVAIVVDGVGSEDSLFGKHPLKGTDWKRERRSVEGVLQKGSERSQEIASRDEDAEVKFRYKDTGDKIRRLTLEANDFESSGSGKTMPPEEVDRLIQETAG